MSGTFWFYSGFTCPEVCDVRGNDPLYVKWSHFPSSITEVSEMSIENYKRRYFSARLRSPGLKPISYKAWFMLAPDDTHYDWYALLTNSATEDVCWPEHDEKELRLLFVVYAFPPIPASSHIIWTCCFGNFISSIID